MLPAAPLSLLGLPLSDLPPDRLDHDDATTPWPLRDYVSPGLRIVRPDAAFPRMRPGDHLHHPWKYLRRDVPHIWYADERFPLMGFLNRDEAILLHNIALPFAGKPALEVGSWLGWSTCHLALAGVSVDVIDPVHDDPELRASVEESLAQCGVADRVNLVGGRSPEAVAALAARLDRKWSLFFIDGDHEAPAPVRDTLACLPFATDDCAFVFHDLASPAVAAGLRLLAERGFHVVVYQTAQIMGMAWRGDVTPVAHIPDPDVAWQVPAHLAGLPISGVNWQRPAATTYRQLADMQARPNMPVAANVQSTQRRRCTDKSRRSIALSPRERVGVRGLSTDYGPQSHTSRASVCIVSNEVVGPFKNGGIATAMTGLAELLAAQGQRVTILYTGGIWAPDVHLGTWRERYAALGIELVSLNIKELRPLQGPLKDIGFGVPWLIYQYLAERHFDVVHFNDCCGEGSLTLAAKKLGLGLHDSLLSVALHSPSQWILELNQTLPASLLLAAYNYAERLSVQCADMVWCPSRYILDWAAQRGFELPDQTFIQQYSIPSPRLREGAEGAASFPPVSYGRSEKPREVVFFGRLEERKGLRLFCNALQLLEDELVRREISVTFLGKPERCAGMPSLDYIARRSAGWRFPIRRLTDLGQPEALEYLRGGGKLAVMPSPLDNSPCTVYEALCWGIPFLATRTGGIPELVDPADHDHVLFEYATEGLRAALLKTIDQGGWIARPAVPQEQTHRSWAAMHAHWRTFLPKPEPHHAEAWGVTAIVDAPAGSSLDATVQSLSWCPSIRRAIILNRGGNTVTNAGHLPLTDIDLLAEDPEIVGGELAALVDDAVLLIHAGVTIVPDRFDVMLAALQRAGVDGLLPAARVIGKTTSRFVPPLGGSASFSLFEGVTFTGAMLVTREALLGATSGQGLPVESPFMGLADFCVAKSSRIWPYPAPVVERTEDCKIEVRSPLPARVAAYDDASPTDRYYMLAAGYGAASHERPIGTKRQLALAMVDLGMAPLLRLGLRSLRLAGGMKARLRDTVLGRLIRRIR